MNAETQSYISVTRRRLFAMLGLAAKPLPAAGSLALRTDRWLGLDPGSRIRITIAAGNGPERTRVLEPVALKVTSDPLTFHFTAHDPE